ncbi:hypothetical protein GWK47_022968 [Chionoecetes opilio]|uniref:Uncharacterized protein n=1 Tax=Chionoecetes opilio TaxID=41210 RepID=A0A8J4XQ26_CHIOP|nr:hypothetical protein GWK47_022968 [Chionoecetes opilio]
MAVLYLTNTSNQAAWERAVNMACSISFFLCFSEHQLSSSFPILLEMRVELVPSVAVGLALIKAWVKADHKQLEEGVDCCQSIIGGIRREARGLAHSTTTYPGGHCARVPMQDSFPYQATLNRKHQLAPATSLVGALLASSTPDCHLQIQPDGKDRFNGAVPHAHKAEVGADGLCT